jgi:hypothetical protein
LNLLDYVNELHGLSITWKHENNLEKLKSASLKGRKEELWLEIRPLNADYSKLEIEA